MFSKRKKKMLKKLLVIFAIAAILGMNAVPFANAATNDSLADVNVLQDVDMGAVLKKVDGKDYYTLDLKLTGNNVADIELLNPEKTAVFYAKELKGKWDVNGTAHVKSHLILPLSKLPVVVELLGEVTDTVDAEVDTLIDAVAELNTLITGTLPLVEIQGIENLDNALDALNNLDDAVVDLLVYDKDVVATKGPDGQITLSYSDNLGARLETAVNEVVVKLLSDVISAINGLKIIVNTDAVGDIPIVGDLPILGGLLDTVGGVLGDTIGDIDTDLLLKPVKDLLIDLLPLVGGITGGLVDLLEDLAAVQVLGNTEITVPLKVVYPSGLNQEVKIYGLLANTSTIDLDLLSKHEDFAIVKFNETGGTTTPVTTTPTTTTTTTTTGNKLPNTSTDMWIYGLTGISTMMAGLGTRYLGRRKK